MKNENSLLAQLIKAFKVLPGVGEKSAQRMAFYLLENNREGGMKLSKLLTSAMENIRNCASCRNLTENVYCDICLDNKRDSSILYCGKSTDVIAIENSGSFKGKYYVLMGRLSPIDGVNPADLGIPKLIEDINANDIKEVIIATSPTIEGDATSFYIKDQITKENILLFQELRMAFQWGEN